MGCFFFSQLKEQKKLSWISSSFASSMVLHGLSVVHSPETVKCNAAGAGWAQPFLGFFPALVRRNTLLAAHSCLIFPFFSSTSSSWWMNCRQKEWGLWARLWQNPSKSSERYELVLMLVWGTAHPCIAPTSDSTSLRVLQCSRGSRICDKQCAGLTHLRGSWFVHDVYRHQSLARKDQEPARKDQEAARLWPHKFSWWAHN